MVDEIYAEQNGIAISQKKRELAYGCFVTNS
jgi:hypothetical protein